MGLPKAAALLAHFIQIWAKSNYLCQNRNSIRDAFFLD